MSDCIFCAPPSERVFLGNDLACALWDAFPVTPLHALVIPRRHAVDYFALTREEVLACHELLGAAREQLIAQDPAIEGFNIGLNRAKIDISQRQKQDCLFSGPSNVYPSNF